MAGLFQILALGVARRVAREKPKDKQQREKGNNQGDGQF